MAIPVSPANSEFLIKPLLRGHFHQAAFFIAVGACAMLLAKCDDPRSLFACFIYSACLLNLFGTSALYHRPNWTPINRARMRRLDHSAIFLLIAGTATPVCLLALSIESAQKLLALVWGASLLGVLQALVWTKASKWLTATFAVITGWLVAPFAAEIRNNIGIDNVAFLVAGGIFYTAGALIYALKRPNPSPKYFGYHEIFHILVVIAAILHFVVVVRIAT